MVLLMAQLLQLNLLLIFVLLELLVQSLVLVHGHGLVVVSMEELFLLVLLILRVIVVLLMG